MARPPAKDRKTLTIHLDPALYTWLHDRANELGVTKTEIVAKALEEAQAK